ncbi:hypothetical protein D3C75_1320030 [compost metagenome]
MFGGIEQGVHFLKQQFFGVPLRVAFKSDTYGYRRSVHFFMRGFGEPEANLFRYRFSFFKGLFKKENGKFLPAITGCNIRR